jgi:hypothetical protein
MRPECLRYSEHMALDGRSAQCLPNFPWESDSSNPDRGHDSDDALRRMDGDYLPKQSQTDGCLPINLRVRSSTRHAARGVWRHLRLVFISSARGFQPVELRSTKLMRVLLGMTCTEALEVATFARSFDAFDKLQACHPGSRSQGYAAVPIIGR